MVATEKSNRIMKVGARVTVEAWGHVMNGIVQARYPGSSVAAHRYDVRLFGSDHVERKIAAEPVDGGFGGWEEVEAEGPVAPPAVPSIPPPPPVFNLRDPKAVAIVEAILMARQIEHEHELVTKLAHLVWWAWADGCTQQSFVDMALPLIVRYAVGNREYINLLTVASLLGHVARP